MQWYFQPFKKYAMFSGRARRREYWTFVLINSVLSGLITAIIQTMNTYSISGIFSLIIIIPTFAVLIRRLHDVGKSGGYVFIVLIPIVGFILLLIQLLKDSDFGDNKYGSNPKN